MSKKVDDYVLGMDCGTTNIKAIIMGADGKIVAEASCPNVFLNLGSGRQEQDANVWWAHACEIFRSLAEQAGKEATSKIRGISISSHTVSLLAVDKNGAPVRNAMTYQDIRSVNETNFIVNMIGLERFVSIVGGQPSVAFLPNKLLWFKKNEPELFAKTKYFMQASSYINMKLTGVATSDIDQALRTQCMDISSLTWSEEIGNVIGIDLDKVMPEVKQVNEIIGVVTKEAAKETGLVEGIPVVAGCSDAMASMYATGLSCLGEAGESSGTSSLVFVGSNKKSRSDIPIVTRPCAIEGMPWVFDAPIQTSGAALKWFIESMAAEECAYAKEHGKNIYSYLNELALEAKPGSNGLYFFPYLLGERAPLWNDYARGMFIGMRMDMKRSELVRSVFEGTAYALRHVIETVKASGGQANVLRVCGGGAKSRTWSMIKASMLNMPVYVLDETAGDVPVGDALIIGHRVGVFKDLIKSAEEIVKVKEVIMPNQEWAEVYDKLYPYYVEMYEKLDGSMSRISKTIDSMNYTAHRIKLQ